jgi:hypothetical protein
MLNDQNVLNLGHCYLFVIWIFGHWILFGICDL